MEHDVEVFKGKKFSDLCKDIYTNSKTTRNQIEILISELRGKINSVNDAMIVVPLIKDYLDVCVRNDDQLVKLAAVVQRITSRQNTAGSDSPFEMTEGEKLELVKAMEQFTPNANDIKSIVDNAKENVK